MGRPKATLDIDGVPLVVRVIGALRAAGLDQVHVIGGDPAELAAAGVTPHPDDDPGAGPLGGILSALVRFDGDLVVAACDLPDLDEPAVRAVVEAGTVYVTVTTLLVPAAMVPRAQLKLGPLEMFEHVTPLGGVIGPRV